MLRHELGVLEELGGVGGLGGAETKTGLEVARQQDRLVRTVPLPKLDGAVLTVFAHRGLAIGTRLVIPSSFRPPDDIVSCPLRRIRTVSLDVLVQVRYIIFHNRASRSFTVPASIGLIQRSTDTVL